MVLEGAVDDPAHVTCSAAAASCSRSGLLGGASAAEQSGAAGTSSSSGVASSSLGLDLSPLPRHEVEARAAAYSKTAQKVLLVSQSGRQAGRAGGVADGRGVAACGVVVHHAGGGHGAARQRQDGK